MKELSEIHAFFTNNNHDSESASHDWLILAGWEVSQIFHAFCLIWITRVFFDNIVGICWMTRFYVSELLLPSSQHFRRLQKGKKYLGYLAGIRIASSVWLSGKICQKINFLRNWRGNDLLGYLASLNVQRYNFYTYCFVPLILLIYTLSFLPVLVQDISGCSR